MREAAVTVDHVYSTPFENHNPMETHNTLAAWEGDKLTLYDSTQGMFSVRGAVAKTFGIPPENVRVVSHFIGGGFGSKGGAWSHVMLAAMAARETSRPVKLVVTRKQMFGPVGGRPRTRAARCARRGPRRNAHRDSTRQHVARRRCSRIGSSRARCRRAYCMRRRTRRPITQLVRLNVGSPTFMRAPGESTGTFALESAMDELASR